MIRLSIEGDRLVVRPESGDLAPRHESQLAYWGFERNSDSQYFGAAASDQSELTRKVVRYLARQGCTYSLHSSVRHLLEIAETARKSLETALVKGHNLKEGSVAGNDSKRFITFLQEYVPRKLKDHQLKAALHLLSVSNGANFSVPGSGKTTVVLSVFHYLRQAGLVDALFVVGPLACFGPWQEEYTQTLGNTPATELLAGENVEERHSKYAANSASACDLYLITFQTLHRDYQIVKILLGQQGIRFFLVIDEAHYIKQLDGAWANAVLAISPSSTRRCILTGTPFPKSYSDAFNLFDTLWPKQSPISTQNKHKITYLGKRGRHKEALKILDNCIGPLFYRVRKAELGLAPQIFEDPIIVDMNPLEKQVYDAILDRIQYASESDYFRDLNTRLRLQRGRMIRLRQCLSYTHLLHTALEDYDESLFEEDQSLANIISRYDDLEAPAKMQVLVNLVEEMMAKSEKVVIWSNFIGTLELIKQIVVDQGHGVHLIYGATPSEDSSNLSDEFTRERCIRDFISRESGINVLVANPAACAESISLHKTCSHAIYYDLSYNCAQFLQSLDRIHRVGGSEGKRSYYHFIQYSNTLDQDILQNVKDKAERMRHIIDKDYPVYSLDMFELDDELAAYERLFGQ